MIRQGVLVSAVGVSMLLSMGACATQGEPKSGSDVFFPIWSQSGDEMTPGGVLKGELVVRNDCLLWDAGEQGVFLPLWPDSFSLTEGSAIATGDGQAINPEDEATLGGGERDLLAATELIGEPIPERCNASSYWMVSSLER